MAPKGSRAEHDSQVKLINSASGSWKYKIFKNKIKITTSEGAKEISYIPLK